MLRDESRPGVKKPLQPASFTYPGLSRTSRDEAASTSSFCQTSRPLSCIWTGRSLSASRTGPLQKNPELRRSVSETFRPSPLGMHSSFGGGPVVVRRSPPGHRRQDGAGVKTGSVQNSKLVASPRDRTSQALSLRALNLQSVSMAAGVLKGALGGAKDSRPSAAEPRSALAAGGAGEPGPGRERPGGGGPGRPEELSTGDSDDSSSSESEREAAPYGARPGFTGSDTETDWRPARSLLEHVFVTDVTANFITVTVKESPTSVGFFSSRNH